MVDELKKLINRASNEISVFKPNSRYFINYTVELNEPIKANVIVSLEKKYNIVLPSDYRDYLLLIGNGGNQPLYGMFSVQQSLALLNKELPSCEVLSNSDLCSRYCRIFHYNNNDDDKKLVLEKDNLTLDDYFDYDTNTFIYQHFLVEGDIASFDEYESRMKRHLLIFSYFDMVHIEYAIALDGIHKGEVIYYTYESMHNIKLTHMKFLEWMINLYKHALDCNSGNFTSMD